MTMLLMKNMEIDKKNKLFFITLRFLKVSLNLDSPERLVLN